MVLNETVPLYDFIKDECNIFSGINTSGFLDSAPTNKASQIPI